MFLLGKHLLIDGLGMDALANEWVGSMDIARCSRERQRKPSQQGPWSHGLVFGTNLPQSFSDPPRLII